METQNNLIVKKIDAFGLQITNAIDKKKQDQKKIVTENPFIEVVDNESHEIAKKHRTALLKGRTTNEKEKKEVVSTLKKNILDIVSSKYDEIISITTPHEEKQQTEVKRYEAIKEQEKQRKIQEEENRKQNHINNIQRIKQDLSSQIKNLTYDKSKDFGLVPMLNNEIITNPKQFEEFSNDYISTIEALIFDLNQKKESLETEEKNRLETERLRKEKFEYERKTSIRKKLNDFCSEWQNLLFSDDIELISKKIIELENLTITDLYEFHQEFLSLKSSFIDKLKKIKKDLKLVLDSKVVFRRLELKEIGFDEDLCYKNSGLNILLTEEHLQQKDEDFLKMYNSIKEDIKKANNRKEIQDTIEPPKSKENLIPAKEISHKKVKPNLTQNQQKSIDFIKKFIEYSIETHGKITPDCIEEFVRDNVTK